MLVSERLFITNATGIPSDLYNKQILVYTG